MIMVEYSEAFKSKMVQRMARPGGPSASELSGSIGVSQPTLSRWLRAAGRVTVMSDEAEKGAGSAHVARRPEEWSAAERLRIVLEASQLGDAELGALLRREGLHEAQLVEWRAAALEALSPTGKRSPKSGAEAKRIRELERQLLRKDKALAEAAALLILQKKVQALWGDADADTESESDK
jgi:transposase-like protein